MLNGGALAGVLVAIFAGASPHRWWPAADFLFVSFAAAAYAEAVVHMARRRAKRQLDAVVPHGVHLRRPFWMAIDASLQVVGFGTSFGAVAAAAGFVSVGVGVSLSFAALSVLMRLNPLGNCTGLTFEPSGLRAHVRGASFLVPWESMTKLDRGGPRADDLFVHIDDIRFVMRSLKPNTPRMWLRARVLLGDIEPAGRLMLEPWIAGFDNVVIARAINNAIAGRTGQIN